MKPTYLSVTSVSVILFEFESVRSNLKIKA